MSHEQCRLNDVSGLHLVANVNAVAAFLDVDRRGLALNKLSTNDGLGSWNCEGRQSSGDQDDDDGGELHSVEAKESRSLSELAGVEKSKSTALKTRSRVQHALIPFFCRYMQPLLLFGLSKTAVGVTVGGPTEPGQQLHKLDITSVDTGARTVSNLHYLPPMSSNP